MEEMTNIANGNENFADFEAAQQQQQEQEVAASAAKAPAANPFRKEANVTNNPFNQ